ncbi:MAG: hypothetical protein WAX69_27230 [Victivallales bacterium]
MSYGRCIHIKTEEDVKNSIFGISHKRYVFDLPDDFSCETLVKDTEFDHDMYYKICFNESSANNGYDISRLPRNEFMGHIGKAIFNDWAKRIVEDGVEFVFLLSPKGDALSLCLGLINYLLKSGGYYGTGDNGKGYSQRHITLPLPVGYALGRMECLKTEGEILRWTCHVDYGIEPIWKEIRTVVISSLSKRKITPLFGNFPIPNPFIMGKFVDKMNIDLNDPVFMDELRSETEKLAIEKFIDKNSSGDADDSLLPELLRRMENWLRCEKIRNWLAIPSEAMLNVSNAKTSFASVFDVRMLGMEDKSGWPAAFSIQFGKGRLSVYPQCVGIEKIVSPDECFRRGVRYVVEEKPIIITKSDENNSSANAVVILDKKVESSDEAKHKIHLVSLEKTKEIDSSGCCFKIKLDSRKPIDMPAHHFLGFLIIWYASRIGNGLIFCSKAEEGKLAKSGLRKFMMLNKDCEPVELPACRFLEKGKEEQPSQTIRRFLSWALFNKQEPEEADRNIISKCLTETFPGDDRKKERIFKKINYTLRKFDIALEIETSIVEDFKKLKLANDIPGAKQVNSGFFSQVIDALNR